MLWFETKVSCSTVTLRLLRTLTLIVRILYLLFVTNKGLAAPIVGIPRLPRLGLGAKRDTELQPDRKRPPKKYVVPCLLVNKAL